MELVGPLFGTDVKDITEYLNHDKLESIKKQVDSVRESYELVGFIGGPPCPDFSIGGKNKGREGENGKLSGTYIELIIQTQPDFFLFENVKGLYRTHKHRNFFESRYNL